jgi:hypothetical protein
MKLHNGQFVPTMDCPVCGEPEHVDPEDGMLWRCWEVLQFERFEPVHLRELA